ncbi:hypothetical protein LX81_03161 [Palleronia aestuarii]|uniref:Lipoprotein n=1 Tax=Palleronia aestuarii TaxID=568105 RepID=A0A2W7NQN0_9RHOB|nr:hypothetical protein [Palleronia aestuarii]PZX13612.1 hypothetical protein LX81_03161 [Palleronia aestuarii]
MRTTLLLAAGLLALVPACGRLADSPLNPFGWLPEARPAAVTLGADAAADPRPLMDQVAALAVTPAPGGVVIRATGIAPAQGWYDGALVPVPTALPSTLAFAFRAAPPATPARVSTPRSREVTVALFVPEAEIRRVREIRVSGARNAQAVSR